MKALLQEKLLYVDASVLSITMVGNIEATLQIVLLITTITLSIVKINKELKNKE